MEKYSLYLLDFDGTLFDTLDAVKEIYTLSFAQYGITPKEEDYPTFMTMSIPLAAKYKGINENDIPSFCKYFNEKVLSPSVMIKTKIYSDTLEFFKFVKKHQIAVGIVTGSSIARVKNVFKYFCIDFNLLKVCVGNESYHHPKPNPEPILVALSQLNYLNKKDEVLYVGDAEQDEECAKVAQVDYRQIKRKHNANGDLLNLLDLFCEN